MGLVLQIPPKDLAPQVLPGCSGGGVVQEVEERYAAEPHHDFTIQNCCLRRSSRKVWSASPSLRTLSGCRKPRLPTLSQSCTDLRRRGEETKRGQLAGDGLSRSSLACARRAGEHLSAPLSVAGLSTEAGDKPHYSSLREPSGLSASLTVILSTKDRSLCVCVCATSLWPGYGHREHRLRAVVGDWLSHYFVLKATKLAIQCGSRRDISRSRTRKEQTAPSPIYLGRRCSTAAIPYLGNS